jgi:uncharacterized protein DUF5906/bifunctional DNA primase/polymerase-like protein
VTPASILDVPLSGAASTIGKARHGATLAEWSCFHHGLELTGDLLPVVSNPATKISARSKLKALGKVPSAYYRGDVGGIANWTSKVATAFEVEAWMKQPDYGICVQTRLVRAIDVDINTEQADEVMADLAAAGAFPVRWRNDSKKFLVMFEMAGDFSKRVIRTKDGIIEFLANGQQFVACGTHPGGARYEWAGCPPGYGPSSIPVLTPVDFAAIWTTLEKNFAVEPSRTSSASVKSKKLADAALNDPVAVKLDELGLVLDTERDGRIHITCPWADQHSRDTGDQATTYFPANTNGYQQGHFKCLHAHCEDRTDFEFLEALDLVPDMADDFKATPPLTAEEVIEQAAVCARNAQKAQRAAQKAITKAKFGSGRDAFEAARREHRKNNDPIDESGHAIPTSEVVSLEEALGRFVFLSDGSRVADLFNPHYDLPQSDWVTTYAASMESIPQPNKILGGGTIAKVPDIFVPVTKLWLKSERRQTVVGRTFKAGGAIILADPAGRSALNSWKPFDRTIVVNDLEAAGIRLFLDHIAFLFPNPDDAGRFLDWLAHIEQQPGVLPHTAWLHIAKNFGLGRNWLASVLVRVWAGSVASNLDLVGMLRTGFNSQLSHKVLAIVDEIREGGRDSHWEHSEKLKSLITEESRQINPKYGRQSIEYNACRWLLFSNHISAIPMEQGDRRIEVVVTDSEPRESGYYSLIYRALENIQFIAAVAKWLADRDIAKFNPGATAANSESKKAVTMANQTPMAIACKRLLDLWPCDLITSQDLIQVVSGDESGKTSTAAYRRTLEQFGIEALDRTTKIGNPLKPTRISILRNKEKWKVAVPEAIRREIAAISFSPGLESPIEYLDALAAETEERVT